MSDVATAAPAAEAGPRQATALVFVHVDIVERHAGGSLACLTGWMAAWDGHAVAEIGVRLSNGSYARCNYPFHRGDTQPSIRLAGGRGMIGFNVTAPEAAGIDPGALEFAVILMSEDGGRLAFRVGHDGAKGVSRKIPLGPGSAIPVPELVEFDAGQVRTVLEQQLIGELARDRHLVLRLDLINKCNLRCVMCHYSDEDYGRRPVQRITPDNFAAFFEPIAAITRDAVLSCGDEPLMSPHFEAILRLISRTDPAVRIRFCTNGMLLTEKIASAIVAANVHLVMFSFDGVTSETLHRIRVGSNYQRIIRNIFHLKKLRALSGAGRPRFVFNFVMLESNIHEAPLFVEVARRLGADYIDFRHVVEYPFYDVRHEMLENYKAKYDFYHARIVAAAARAGLEVYLPPAYDTLQEHDPSADPKGSLAEFDALIASLGGDAVEHIPLGNDPVELAKIRPAAHLFCDRPFTETQVREQKDVYPCPWHREKMGTLAPDVSMADIFFGEKFQKLRLAMLDPNGAPGCQGCPIKANYLPTSY